MKTHLPAHVAVLAQLVEAHETAGTGVVPSVPAEIGVVLAEMSKSELEACVVLLAERFVMAMKAASEQLMLMAITDLNMHPHEADRINLPTMLGSLAGIGLPVPEDGTTCSTCAFRPGTSANQNAIAVEDAQACLANAAPPFMCHESPLSSRLNHTRVCRGYAQALKQLKGEKLQ